METTIDLPSLREYILFSKAVLGGPMIIPVQFLRSMSSSFSSPQLERMMKTMIKAVMMRMQKIMTRQT